MLKAHFLHIKSNTTLKSSLIVTIACAAYLIISNWLIGFKPEQVFLVVLFNFMYYVSLPTRRFILGFSIFIVFWVIFDTMKAFPNYRYANVHIEDLYNAEKTLFGINVNGTYLTPNEYWKINHNTFLNIITGIFYLCWVPVPLAFATYLFFKRKQQFYFFSLTFLFVNLIGFVFYYIYPAAPPWYVQEHGFEFISGTPGNTGGLSRFDSYFNTSIFKSLYAKSSNVFAAMPSLHSAYPVIVLYYGLKNKLGFINLFFGLVMVGIWFSAIYTSHHYTLDVLAGIACALTGIILFNLFLRKPVAVYLNPALAEEIKS